MSATVSAIEPLTLKARLTCALFVFIASLVVYARTLAPTVTLVDSGELIVAAKSLGVAHPPGFPLYVLLAHLATLVPLGNVAARVNFASALFAALASAAVSLVVIEAMTTVQLPRMLDRTRRKAERKKDKKSRVSSLSQPDGNQQDSFVIAASSIASGLLLAYSRTFWSFATLAEAYTLTSLLILIIFLLMFRWRRQFIEASVRPAGSTTRVEDRRSPTGANVSEAAKSQAKHPVTLSNPYVSLYAAAIVFGLALGVHHVSVGLILPALAVLVFVTAGVAFFLSKRLLYAALFAFGGLFLVYAYLPIAASRSPIMNWGDPRTMERLWWQITGKQYQVFFTYSLKTVISQFKDFVALSANEFGPWWIPAACLLTLAGFVSAFRRDRVIFWFLSLVIVGNLTYSLGYEIAEDKGAYYLPVFIAMTIAAGFGVRWFMEATATPFVAHLSQNAKRVIATTLLVLVTAVALVGNLPYNNRSRYFIAQDYVQNILSSVEPGGMLLTRDWQVYSPLLYFQEVEGVRKDTVVIDVNQLRRSWYFDYLRQAYPATIEQAREKVDPFLEDLRHWEHDPDLYQRDLALNQRINSRFYEMILAFVTNHIHSSPVYLTLDIAGNREGQDAELTKSLAGSYQFVPQGLIFQITPDREFQQPAESALVLRGLADGTLKFENDDVVMAKVFPVYVNMLYNRGRYLAAHGRHEQAIEAFKGSLALNPRFTAAQQAANESANALRKGAVNTP